MKTLYVSDLDGTLLRKNETFFEKTGVYSGDAGIKITLAASGMINIVHR